MRRRKIPTQCPGKSRLGQGVRPAISLLRISSTRRPTRMVSQERTVVYLAHIQLERRLAHRHHPRTVTHSTTRHENSGHAPLGASWRLMSMNNAALSAPVLTGSSPEFPNPCAQKLHCRRLSLSPLSPRRLSGRRAVPRPERRRTGGTQQRVTRPRLVVTPRAREMPRTIASRFVFKLDVAGHAGAWRP